MPDDADTPTTDRRAERLAEVHDRAMRGFDVVWSAVQEERAAALFDRRFATIRGAQWEGQGAPVDDDADENGGPARMEVPKFLRPIRRMLGEYRASRKTVDFKPKGDDSDRASADNLDGLYRADENDSNGQAAYDNAFAEAIKGGIGGWRLRARYEDDSDEENEHQRISLEPIYDADQSLFFDLDAKAQDKSDARRAWLLFTLGKEAFEERYPDASPTTFADKLDWAYDWTQPDTITLAEYFEVEDRSVLRRTFRLTLLDKAADDNPDIQPDEQTYDDAELKAEQESGKTLERELRDKGYRQVRQRRIKRQRVRKYLVSGSEVLEDEGYIAGCHIPLVPLYAERSYVDGIERSQGMVRPAIDPTRINNLVVSNLAESANNPSSRVPIFAPEQMDTAIANDWSRWKRDRLSFLLAKPVYASDGDTIIQAGPSGFLEPDPIPETVAALMQVMGGTIDELMGVNAAAETVPANTSAAAIELVNDRGDVNDFLWHDNFALAMQRSGQIWLGMAKELYVEEGRKMVALDGEGKQSLITLAEPKHDGQAQYVANDLTKGKYDVIVDVGPATKTRRDATVKSCLNIAEMATQLAAAGVGAAGDVAFSMLGTAITQMEGEGIDGPRGYVRKMGVQAGWVEPNEEEKQALQAAQEQEQQPDPNVLLAQAQMIAAQAEVTKAETGRLEAETRKIAAEAQATKARADAAAALAGIDRADRAQILAEVRAETDSDRADDELHLEVARTTTEFERHDRDMTQPEVPNGDAA